MAIKGLYDGKWTYYNEFGFRIGDGNYHQGNGTQRAFHQNGKLWIEVPYASNKRNGVGREYNNNGKLIKESIYKDDILIETKSFE